MIEGQRLRERLVPDHGVTVGAVVVTERLLDGTTVLERTRTSADMHASGIWVPWEEEGEEEEEEVDCCRGVLKMEDRKMQEYLAEVYQQTTNRMYCRGIMSQALR